MAIINYSMFCDCEGPLVYLEAVDDAHLAEVVVFTGAIWAIGER